MSDAKQVWWKRKLLIIPAGILAVSALVAPNLNESSTIGVPTTPSVSVSPSSSPTTSTVPTTTPKPFPKKESLGSENAKVSRTVDGDTIKVVTESGTKLTVRVLGIDTPETKDPRKPVQCYGPEASAAAEMLVDRDVILVYDSTQGKTDKYGRTLAYVEFIAYDGSRHDYGHDMIVDGFAREYTYTTKYARQTLYRNAQAGAQKVKIGIWKDCNNNPSPTPSPSSTVLYANCTEVRAAGKAPIKRGDPGYSSRLDKDNDGIACDK